MATTSHNYKASALSLGAYAQDAIDGGDPIKVILCAGYVYDPDHVFASELTGEITTGSTTRATVTGLAINTAGTGTTVTADDPTHASCTFTGCDSAVIISWTGSDATSPLLGHVTLPTVANTAEPFVLTLADGVLFEATSAEPDVLTVAGITPNDAGDIPVATLGVELYDYLTGIDITAPSGNVFVYNSAATPAGNIYDDFTALCAAAAEVGGPITIACPTDQTIPAGTYTLPEAVRFAGPGPSWTFPIGATLTLADGVVFDGPTTMYAESGLLVLSESTDPIISPNGYAALSAESGGAWATTGDVILDQQSVTALTVFALADAGGFYNGANPSAQSAGSGPIARINGGLAIISHKYGQTWAAEDIFEGTASAYYVEVKTTAANGFEEDPTLIPNPAQPNLTSGVDLVAYHNRAFLDWYDNTVSGLTAENVQDAIDELAASGGGGSVATDAIFDAKGDLPVGTGANTAAKLSVGANDTIAMAASGEATGIKWATPSTVRTALSLVPGTDVQAYDADLAAVAGLSPSNDDVLQRKAGAWTNRTMAQLRADLWQPATVYKSSDETISSDNTLSDDSTLLYAIGASEVWHIDAELIFTSGSTPDFQCTVTGPSGATCELSVFGPTTTDAAIPHPYRTLNSYQALATTTAVGGLASSVRGMVHIRGTIFNSTNAGNVTIQWAQNTSDASNTVVRKGSTLLMRRLA